MKHSNLRRMTVAGLFGAIAFVLMYFSFGIPVISPFAEFDLSALPELIGGYVLGPIGAVYITIIKLLLKLLFQGTSSMFTGEVQNLILSISYVLPAILYYRKHRTKKGAIIGLALGTVISIVMAVLTNLYLIFPAYIALYGMNWDGIIEICTAANPMITNIPTFVAFSVIPFNIISRVISSVIAMLVYKKISIPLKKMLQEE
jgi:riboflavin transporter FmnP